MDKETIARAKTIFDQAAQKFFQSGTRYLASLDAWIETKAEELKQFNVGATGNNGDKKKRQDAASAIRAELKELRGQREEAEETLRRMFPDEFADTCSAAE